MNPSMADRRHFTSTALSAATAALFYVSQPHVWPEFGRWAEEMSGQADVYGADDLEDMRLFTRLISQLAEGMDDQP